MRRKCPPQFSHKRRVHVLAATAMLQASLLVGAAEGELASGPKSYTAHRASVAPKIDGRLDDPAWQVAPWSDAFVDIEGDSKPRPRYETRAKMLWNDKAFFICAHMEEPHVWATLTKHDSVIFHDNDFEVFIDPDGDTRNYGELEINALNTTWDLFLNRPYRSRGRADNGWEIAGMQTAVHVDGTLNDPSDVDKAWSVEIAIPWAGLKRLGVETAPKSGDRWRVNFSRVQWKHRVDGNRYIKTQRSGEENNWVWSPIGIVSMHEPEHWGFVEFSEAAPAKSASP